MNTQTREQYAVAVYDTHDAAESALKALKSGGVDMKNLSIVGKDFQTEERAVGFYTQGDRMAFWGARGAFWGSLWGMLFGGAMFFIPAIGPVIVMGPLVAWIVGTLEGAVLGTSVGVLAAALSSIGMPDDAIVKYELDVKAGKFLVLARGDAGMVQRARTILGLRTEAEPAPLTA